MKHIFFILSLISGMAFLQLKAQNVIVELPDFNGQIQKQQLGLISIINSGSPVNSCVINVQIMQGTQLIYQLSTRPITLTTGSTTLLQVAGGNTQEQFGNNNTAIYFKNTGILSYGAYSLDADVVAYPSGQVIAANSNESLISAMTSPLELQSPANGDSIYTLNPVLTWIPPTPVSPQLVYRVEVNELKDDNTLGAQAFAYPVSEILWDYTSTNNSLQFYHTYVWDVVAYINNTEIGRSDQWKFTPINKQLTIHSDSSIVKKPDSTRVYWILKNKLDAGHLIVNKTIYLSLENNSTDSLLRYRIADMASQVIPIDSLPKVKIKRGNNYIAIRLSGNKSFITGHEYMLSVLGDLDKTKYVVRFNYTNQ